MPPKQPMSAEEKLRRLKIIKARNANAEQMKIQMRRDHLARELKCTELNWSSIKANFHQMMLKAQLPWIKEDVETMRHRFEFTIDVKNHIIQCVLDELDEDQLQTEYNLVAHVEEIDLLIIFHMKRWDELHASYQVELMEMLHNAQENTVSIKSRQTADEEHINLMCYCMEKKNEEKHITVQADIVSKLDEEMDKFKDIHRIMCGAQERILEDLWDLFKVTLSTYEANTLEKRKVYEAMQKRDIRGAHMIYRQKMHTQKLYDVTRTLREKLHAIQPQQVLKHLLEERNFFAEAFCELRDRLINERKHDQNQLIRLTVESNTSMKWLECIVSKGSQILQLAAICRKLETQHDKVIPFPQFVHKEHPYKMQEPEEYELKREKEYNLLQVYRDYCGMEWFWLRVGQVKLNYANMLKYQKELDAENKHLRNVLCSYLATVSTQNSGNNDKCITRNKYGYHTAIETSFNILP